MTYEYIPARLSKSETFTIRIDPSMKEIISRCTNPSELVRVAIAREIKRLKLNEVKRARHTKARR